MFSACARRVCRECVRGVPRRSCHGRPSSHWGTHWHPRQLTSPVTHTPAPTIPKSIACQHKKTKRKQKLQNISFVLHDEAAGTMQQKLQKNEAQTQTAAAAQTRTAAADAAGAMLRRLERQRPNEQALYCADSDGRDRQGRKTHHSAQTRAARTKQHAQTRTLAANTAGTMRRRLERQRPNEQAP